MTTSKSKLKKVALGGAILIVVLVIGLALYVKSISHERPSGKTGPAAEALAQKMLTSINHDAWKKTGAVSWAFPRGHRHLWDRTRNWAQVRWGEHDVLLSLADKRGIVKTNGAIVEGDAKKKLIEKAWALWANDSFWLNPISKIMDAGVTRTLVKDDQGKDALLVTYASGGVTPGDSYLWLLDDNHRPKAWRMWVSIIPISGLEFSWESWQKLKTGAMVAPIHKGVASINLKDVKAAATLKALIGANPDPFKPLEAYLNNAPNSAPKAAKAPAAPASQPAVKAQ